MTLTYVENLRGGNERRNKQLKTTMVYNTQKGSLFATKTYSMRHRTTRKQNPDVRPQVTKHDVGQTQTQAL